MQITQSNTNQCILKLEDHELDGEVEQACVYQFVLLNLCYHRLMPSSSIRTGEDLRVDLDLATG